MEILQNYNSLPVFDKYFSGRLRALGDYWIVIPDDRGHEPGAIRNPDAVPNHLMIWIPIFVGMTP